ncbi:MAG: nuclear transport factor 2 family protein [Eudoraea sp.]|nr:nuclear transport factor 2 family protein [Muriicola sp.]NNE02189.1 nuclear transport factor 2 family protein [Eudoraea sp.]
MNKGALIVILMITVLSARAQNTAVHDIGEVVDAWHLAAANADFDAYFSILTEDAVFIGTDAAEVWDKAEFMTFSKPYFDKGKAWSFTSKQRNVYVDASGEIAWFDELLDTWMQLCRGSGVLKKVNGTWKISHYVLSLTIPNDEIQKVITVKKESDSLFLKSLVKKQ